MIAGIIGPQRSSFTVPQLGLVLLATALVALDARAASSAATRDEPLAVGTGTAQHYKLSDGRRVAVIGAEVESAPEATHQWEAATSARSLPSRGSITAALDSDGIVVRDSSGAGVKWILPAAPSVDGSRATQPSAIRVPPGIRTHRQGREGGSGRRTSARRIDLPLSLRAARRNGWVRHRWHWTRRDSRGRSRAASCRVRHRRRRIRR